VLRRYRGGAVGGFRVVDVDVDVDLDDDDPVHDTIRILRS
jgi:hypothetical protein